MLSIPEDDLVHPLIPLPTTDLQNFPPTNRPRPSQTTMNAGSKLDVYREFDDVAGNGDDGDDGTMERAGRNEIDARCPDPNKLAQRTGGALGGRRAGSRRRRYVVAM